jgi:mannose-1-phosphate guanylyltransferase/mannose-6-phosphate isomerase
MTAVIVPAILSGGSGKRLWPRSTEETPKQLLALLGDRTMLQETAARLGALRLPVKPPLVVCGERHAEPVAAQLAAIGVRPGAIVLEPVGRNSAPAVAVAALLAQRSAAPDEDALVLALPADHVIANLEAFAAAVEAAAGAAAQGYLVTFGIVPTRAETGYGYILRGEQRGAWALVQRFVEKPDPATARTLVESGRYFWNSGMLLFAARTMLDELKRHAPEILAACERALPDAVDAAGMLRLGPAFLACPADSIDYAVMEKTDRAALVPLAADWSDVGSWAAVHDASPKDANGNAALGDVVLDSCFDTYVAASGRLVMAVGLEDVVIVETEHAVLVIGREHSDRLKSLVDALPARRATETPTR